MVIHDMRSPTSSIQLGLQQTIFKLREIISIYKEHLDFNLKCEQLQDSRSKLHRNDSIVNLNQFQEFTCIELIDMIYEKVDKFNIKVLEHLASID